MSESVRISEVIAPKFYSAHQAIKNGSVTEVWLKGGRGSTKSSFAAVEIILGVMRDPNANAICLRKVGDTIRTSLLTTFLWAINILNVNAYFRATVSPPEITYLPTGQKIILKGTDDPLKMKSIRMEKGYFKFLWFEETAEFSGMEEIRNIEQSIIRGGDTFVEFFTYNPPNDPAAWVNKESRNAYPDRLVHHSTYLDVPQDWLGEKFIEKALRLKESDQIKYDHEYLGEEVGRAEQIIFYGKWSELDFESPQAKDVYQGRFFYGADWGFANDPTALIRCFIRKDGSKNNLYVDYEAGGAAIEIDDLPETFDRMPGARKWKWYGDAARPETVSYMSRQGFDIESAPKWKGSVEDGIEYLKGFDRIYVHPRCRRLIEEFKKYSYKVDRHTQEILPEVVDAWNHWIDALRYSLALYIKADVSIFDAL